MNNYVISLTSAMDRRKHIEEQFGKQDITFKFFDAITPDQIDTTSQYLNIDLMSNAKLSEGEKGCFLSHVYLWQKMLDENIDYLAIFEDDIYLGENACLFLKNHNWLCNYDLIKIELFDEKCELGVKCTYLQDNRHLRLLFGCQVGMAGYIISQKTAQLLLNYIRKQNPVNLSPIDHIMFEFFPQENLISIYQMLPALVIQSDRYAKFFSYNGTILNSQLENERMSFRENNPLTIFYTKRKLTISQKIKRELTRPFIQIYHFFYPKSEKVEIGFR